MSCARSEPGVGRAANFPAHGTAQQGKAATENDRKLEEKPPRGGGKKKRKRGQCSGTGERGGTKRVKKLNPEG